MKYRKQSSETSRREFIRRSALGLGALGIGLPMVKGTSRFEMSKVTGRLGVALVGLGGYSTGQLAPALLETNNCYLAGIVTGTKEKESSWMAKYNIPQKNVYNYENFDSIKDNPDIDIVYVVLPNSMHAEYTIRAAKAGKHVICEKPMALSIAECEQMIAVCEENKVLLSIGYRLHFDTNTKKIINLSVEKPYGNIKYVNADFGFRIGNPSQWRLKKALAGGGASMDIGIYCIQAARYSIGEEPVRVSAQKFTTDPEKFKEVEESLTWQLEFPGGGFSNSSASYNFSVNRHLISMEKGRATLDPAFGYSGIKGAIGDTPLGVQNINQQALHMDAFAQNIMDNTQPLVNGQEGLNDLRVIEAIYKSIETGGKTIEI